MRKQKFLEMGIKPILAEITSELPDFPEVETVLFAVGFDRSSVNSIEEVYVDGLANVLDSLPNSVKRFIYISSTGVYGQSDGEWIDEDSLCLPTRAGGKACLAAEKIIQSSKFQNQAIILRLAGIYGPGRVPRLARMKSGDPFEYHSDGYLNLIHVDDAASIVVASERLDPPNLFVVSDGNPVSRRTFYEYAAQIVGISPKFVELESGSGRETRSIGSKRCRTDKLVAHLNPAFKYPSYREGLRMALANKNAI